MKFFEGVPPSGSFENIKFFKKGPEKNSTIKLMLDASNYRYGEKYIYITCCLVVKVIQNNRRDMQNNILSFI